MTTGSDEQRPTPWPRKTIMEVAAGVCGVAGAVVILVAHPDVLGAVGAFFWASFCMADWEDAFR